MKFGIVRRVDELGRLVLPKCIRMRNLYRVEYYYQIKWLKNISDYVINNYR